MNHEQRAARARIRAGVREALADTRGRAARRSGFDILRARTTPLIRAHDDFAADLRRRKLDALERHDSLVTLAVARLEENGFDVFLADSGHAAVERVLSLLPAPGLVVKSKSNMAKELHLADALVAHGLTVVETDLGDRINQLAGTSGGHVLAPAVSVSRERIRQVLSREVGEELPDDIPVQVAAARRSLRRLLLSADYGLTGANAIVAKTGTVCLMENEGNIRMASSLPRRHVVVAGIHKIVPSLDDAVRVARGASLFGSGQVFGNYLSCISGPGDGETGPQDVHVVLVDDRRGRMLDTAYREAFACISCGSCLNHCPVYAEVGDAFGGTRVGGIGCLQTALLEGTAAGDRDGASLCLGCGTCVAVCPVKIDTPGLLDRLRADAGLAPAPLGARAVLAAVESGDRLAAAGGLIRLYQRTGIQRALRRSGLLARARLAMDDALLPERVQRVDLPSEVRPRGSRRGSERGALRGSRRGSVDFFRGCLMDELMGSINADTLEVLALNGYRVSVPAGQGCCGALHAHAGDVDEAKALARRNVAAFPGDRPVVTNSGGCGAMLKQYGELLADDPDYADRAAALAARVRDLSEALADGGLRGAPALPPTRVTYHDSCHLAQVQGITQQPRALLRSVAGVELVEMAPGEACCGSGGTWSLRFPDLAARLSQERLDEARRTDTDLVVTANPGCLLHLSGGDVDVIHLAELLARAYRSGGVSAREGATIGSVQAWSADEATTADATQTESSPPDIAHGLESPDGRASDPRVRAEAGADLTALRAGGWHVFVAGDAAEAADHVARLAAPGETVTVSGADPWWTHLRLADAFAERGIPVVAASDESEPGPIRERLAAAATGITGASSIATDTGTVILAEEGGLGRLVSSLPYTHVVLAPVSILVPTLADAVAAGLRSDGRPPRYLSGISGPSKTGDIGMEIVPGVHGPGHVHLVLLAGA